MERGKLIVIEGADRCGKTTQCARLVERMNGAGIVCESMRFPNRETEIGKIIDSYLKGRCDLSDRAIHLLFCANRWEMEPIIQRKLAAGITLVVDRWTYSGQVFTFIKGEVSAEWCGHPDLGLPTPDLAIFLDVPIEESMRRGGFGDERYERAAVQRRARKAFMRLLGPKGLLEWADGTGTIEQVEGEIWELVTKIQAGKGG